MNKPASKIIEEDIKNKIQLGVYGATEALPSENELAEKYDVSRATVQKALSSIIAEKLIYSVPGKGYFVREVNFNKYRLDYKSFSEHNVKYLGVKVISPPPEVIYYLHIHPKNKVLEVERIAYKGEKPIMYDIMYTPYVDELAPFVEHVDVSSMNDVIHNFVSPYEISRTITFQTESAPENACARLDVPGGTIMVIAERSIMNDEGECFGWGKRYILPQYFNLKMER